MPDFCTEPGCRAEVVVRRGADTTCPGKFKVRCCCGKDMAREDYILTNNHVIDGSTDIRVTTYDKHEYKARIVGTDPRTDIAVLKIDGKDLPYITIGDSSIPFSRKV